MSNRKVVITPVSVQFAGRRIEPDPGFREHRWSGPAFGAVSFETLTARDRGIFDHLGDTVESVFSLNGCEDLPPTMREAFLRIEHAYRTWSTAASLIAAQLSPNRAALAPQLMSLLEAITDAEEAYIEMLAETRAKWVATLLAEPAPRFLRIGMADES